MIRELDREMKRRHLDAILVFGESTYGNPDFYYVVGAHLPRGGLYVKKRGDPAQLVVSNIDVGSAQQGRVKAVKSYSDYEYEKLAQKHGRSKAWLLLNHRILTDLNARGKIGIYGWNKASATVKLADALRGLGHRVVGEQAPGLLEHIRATKDRAEIRKLRSVAARTERVMSRVRDFLRACKVHDNVLQAEGRGLTVGAVKSVVNRYLAEEGLIASEGVIFAVGPPSADPHFLGNTRDVVYAHQPIVFDLFPQEAGGYWFDTTCTWVVGTASPALKRMYEVTLEVQQAVLEKIRAGVSAKMLMNLACAWYEKKGYLTVRHLLKGRQKARSHGFIHGLGHGAGLTIGEPPSLSLASRERLRVGHVITVEPGLYDPRVGGVRIEDVVVVTSSGCENLSKLDKELEI